MLSRADKLPIQICPSRKLVLLLLLVSIALSIILVPLCLLLISGATNSGVYLFIKPMLWLAIVAAPVLVLMLIYLLAVVAKRCVEIKVLPDGGVLIKSAKGATHKLNQVEMVRVQKVSLLRPGYFQYFASIVGDDKEVLLGMAMSINKIMEMIAPVENLTGTRIEISNDVITILNVYAKYR